MKWEVTLADQTKVTAEADLCHIQDGGTLAFIMTLGQEKSVDRTIDKAYAPSTWLYVTGLDLQPSPSTAKGAPVKRGRGVRFNEAELQGVFEGTLKITKPEMAKRLEERLGIGRTKAYQIIKKLIGEHRVIYLPDRDDNDNAGLRVLDPKLNPTIRISKVEWIEWIQKNYGKLPYEIPVKEEDPGK
jgi:hypothetical protein